MRTGRYRARRVKRRWITKAGSKKLRPLGIPVLEDKIVQQAVKQILESIWEDDFVDESIGYRPGRGARQAVRNSREALNDGNTAGSWRRTSGASSTCRSRLAGADAGATHRGPSLIRLIGKWLKAGVMEEGSDW